MTGETDLDGTPLPDGWPTVKAQQDYWNSLPEYECPVPKCGTLIRVGTIEDELNCPECRSRLTVSRDGEFRDGLWRDLTKLILIP